MTLVIHSKHDSWAPGMFPQDTWGSSAAANAVFREIGNNHSPISKDTNLRRPDRSFSGQRHQDIGDIQNDEKGSMPSINLSGDVRRNDLADLLYFVMQNVVEDDNTPFKKTFTFHATQPDFTTNEGFFATICNRNPVASQSQAIIDAIGREITFSCAPGTGEDRLQFNANYVGRGPAVDAWDPSGTWSRSGALYFYFHDIGGLTKTSTEQDLISISDVKITNNAIPVGVEKGTGKFNSFALPKYEMSGKIKVVYGTATALSYHAALDTGAMFQLEFWWGNDPSSATGDLKFDLYVTVTDAKDEKGDVHSTEFTWEVVSDRGNTKVPVTITLCDAQDKGW